MGIVNIAPLPSMILEGRVVANKASYVCELKW